MVLVVEIGLQLIGVGEALGIGIEREWFFSGANFDCRARVESLSFLIVGKDFYFAIEDMDFDFAGWGNSHSKFRAKIDDAITSGSQNFEAMCRGRAMSPELAMFEFYFFGVDDFQSARSLDDDLRAVFKFEFGDSREELNLPLFESSQNIFGRIPLCFVG